MNTVEGEFKFDEEGEEMLGFFLDDGREVVEYDGCDWKENPGDILVGLAKKLARLGDNFELVEIFDGSDTLWYGIVPVKVSA